MTETDTPTAPSGDRTAVLLVHGVGDPAPGDVLRKFTSSLALHENSGLTLEGPIVERRLEDRSQPPSPVRHFFPLHLLTGRLRNREVVFAEVFWGEASRVAPGVMGVLRALFELIFGLEAVVTGNTRGGRASGLERLSVIFARLGSETLRGPVFAANVLLGLGVATALAGGLLLGKDFVLGDPNPVPWAIRAIAVAGLLTAGIGVLLLRRDATLRGFQGHRPLHDYRWFARFCILGGIAWPVAGRVMGTDTWREWARLAFDPLLWSFGIVSLCVLAVGLIYLVAVAGGFAERRSKRAGKGWIEFHRAMSARIMALALQFGLWGAIVPTLWLFLLSLVGGNIAIQDASLQPADLGPCEDPDQANTWIGMFRAAVPSDGVQWLFVVPVGLAVAIIVLRRRLAIGRAMRSSKPWPPASMPPRLIVNPLIRESMVAAAFIGVAASFWLVLATEYLGVCSTPLLTPVVHWIREFQVRALPVAGVAFASSFLVENVRIVLDVANDVIHYLRLRVELQPRSANQAPPDERLRPIRGKFNEVVRHLAREVQFDRLVVLAHSQGTVLAIEELTASRFGQPEGWLEGKDVRLVTLGSPMANLYQEYFPSTFPGWEDARWDRLARRVRRWLNIYRLDDYVGTTLGTNEHDRQRLNVREACVGDGGHLHYWSDERVIREIVEQRVLT
jgi:hypothetical protein